MGAGHDAGDAGIETLGDALDHAPLAGGIAPFEHNDHPVAAFHDPVVHLHQLALEAEKFGEVAVAGGLVGIVLQRPGRGVRVELLPIVPLHLELLIVVVDEFAMNSADQAGVMGGFFFGHGKGGMADPASSLSD